MAKLIVPEEETTPPPRDEVDPIRSAGTPGGALRRRPNKALDRLEEDLSLVLVEMGTAMSLALPFTGWFFVKRAPDRARALTVLAERDERVRKALERMVKVTVFGVIAGDVADTAVTAGIDLGRVDPHGTFSELRGIAPEYDEWEAVAGREEEGEEEQGGGPDTDGFFPAPRGGTLLDELAGQAQTGVAAG